MSFMKCQPNPQPYLGMHKSQPAIPPWAMHQHVYVLTLLTSMFIVETTKSRTQRPVDYGGKMVPPVKCHIIKCQYVMYWYCENAMSWNVMSEMWWFFFLSIRWLCSWKMKVNCTQNTAGGINAVCGIGLPMTQTPRKFLPCVFLSKDYLWIINLILVLQVAITSKYSSLL